MISLLMLTAQLPAQRDWSHSVHYSKRLFTAFHNEALSVETTGWSLVLIPEYIGVALLGRNAQGAFVRPPFQEDSYLDSMVPFIGSDLSVWYHEISNMDQGSGPGYFYCADASGTNLLRLDISDGSDSFESWRKQWLHAVAGSDCAGLIN